MTSKHYVRTKLRRMGAISIFSTAMMMTLAACGTPATVQPTPTQTATITLQVEATLTPVGGIATTAATATTETTQVPTAVSTEPAGTTMGGTPTIPGAVTTQTTDPMDGLMDMTPSPASPGTSTTPTAASQGGQSNGTSTEIKGTLREWAIDLSQKEASAGMIRFVVTNEGQFKHNFTVTDSSGKIAGTPDFTKAEGEQIVEIELKAGTYSIICDLPGHAARGQKTEFVVK